MDHGKKLMELLGVNTLKEYSEPANCAELWQTGQFYSDMCDGARGEQHVQRVSDEFARFLAEVVQPIARKRYGVADALATRQLLAEAWGESAEGRWQRLKILCQTAISDLGLTRRQEAVLMELVYRYPDVLLDSFADQAAWMSRIPAENVNEVIGALAEMFKEDERRADALTNSRQAEEAGA